MKKLIIKLIDLYQTTPMHAHSYCRYIPTCSEYTKQAVEIYGTRKGLFLGIKRISRCHPLGGHGIDNVPIKEEK